MPRPNSPTPVCDRVAGPQESLDPQWIRIWKRIGVEGPHSHSCPSNSLGIMSVWSNLNQQCFHLSLLLPFGYQPTWSVSSTGSHLILVPSPCLCSCLSVLFLVFSNTPLSALPKAFASQVPQWTKIYFSLLFFSSLFKCCFLKETFLNPLIRSDILVMWTYSILYFLLALCYLEFMGSQWIYFNCMFNAYFIHLILNFIRPELILSCSTL